MKGAKQNIFGKVEAQYILITQYRIWIQWDLLYKYTVILLMGQKLIMNSFIRFTIVEISLHMGRYQMQGHLVCLLH